MTTTQQDEPPSDDVAEDVDATPFDVNEWQTIEVYGGDEVLHRLPVVHSPTLPFRRLKGKVRAYGRYKDNATMIAHAAELGFVGGPGDWWCDLTYGRGIWWKHHRPGTLTPYTGDLTDCPYPSEFFDGVAYDPPYVAQGGRSTSTLQDFLGRYGLNEVPKSADATQELILKGLEEAKRIVKPGGLVLVKCMDYITSGKFYPGERLTRVGAAEMGFREVCKFVLTSDSGRAQPTKNLDGSARRQVHPVNNGSTLLVLSRLK